jgi:hypothetical protein
VTSYSIQTTSVVEIPTTVNVMDATSTSVNVVEVGLIGPQGSVGAQGIQGPTGATGPAGVVQSITAADGTVVVAGTDTVPTIAVGTVPNAQVSGLAASATVNTTNASNITSGTLPNARLVSVPDSALDTISTAGKVSNTATTATNANTASAIVARDASGNFSAGTISAALTGNVTGNVSGSSGSTTGNAATVTNGVYTTDTGTVTSTMILDGTIVNADINASAAIAASKISGTAYTVANRTTEQYQPTAGIDVIPRMFVTGSRTTVNGTVYMTAFTPFSNVTVSNIITLCSTGGTDTGGTTVRRMGLFTFNTTNNTYALVARTASDATLWNTAGTTYTRAFDTTGGYPSSYTLQAGTTYSLGIIAYNTGGTFAAPALAGNAGLIASVYNLSPFMWGNTASQTDLPATGTSFTGTSNTFWARLT